jgi:hypothetical protein
VTKYPYIHAFAQYAGWENSTLSFVLAHAQEARAPRDACMFLPEDDYDETPAAWLTMRRLHQLTGESSETGAMYTQLKRIARANAQQPAQFPSWLH